MAPRRDLQRPAKRAKRAKEGAVPGLETTDEMFDLRMSEGAKPLFNQVVEFIKKEVDPITL